MHFCETPEKREVVKVHSKCLKFWLFDAWSWRFHVDMFSVLLISCIVTQQWQPLSVSHYLQGWFVMGYWYEISYIRYQSMQSMSRQVQARWRSAPSSACLLVFFFPSCAGKDKACLFVQQLIVGPYMFMSLKLPHFTVVSAEEEFPLGSVGSCVDRKQWWEKGCFEG